MRPGIGSMRRPGLLCAILMALALAGPAISSTHGASHPERVGTVVIDPGHGGRDQGTHSKAHLLEKSINLSVASAVATELQHHGVDAVLTRRRDVSLELQDRAELANHLHARLFVSLHCDFNRARSMDGFSVLLPKISSWKTAVAARTIASRMQGVGIERRTVRRDDRGLYVLDATRGPAVLVEMGFLSNSQDAANLARGDYQKKLARAIAAGIVDFLRRH